MWNSLLKVERHADISDFLKKSVEELTSHTDGSNNPVGSIKVYCKLIPNRTKSTHSAISWTIHKGGIMVVGEL